MTHVRQLGSWGPIGVAGTRLGWLGLSEAKPQWGATVTCGVEDSATATQIGSPARQMKLEAEFTGLTHVQQKP